MNETKGNKMNISEKTETVKTSDLRVGDKVRSGDRFDGFLYFTITAITTETLMSGRKITRVATDKNPVGSIEGASKRWNKLIG